MNVGRFPSLLGAFLGAFLAAFLFAVLVPASPARAETPAAAPPTAADAGPCDPDAGTCAPMTVKQLFDAKCAGCHGLDAKGKTKYGKKHDIPNFATRKWQKEIGDAEIGQKIREGVVDHGKKVMPPFKNKLAPDQIAALTVYVRSFKP